MSEEKKPLLHQSMLSMFLRCGQQFKYRYIDGIKIMPGFALHIGSAVHGLQEYELGYKVNHMGSLIPEDEAQDVCRNVFEEKIRENGLKLDETERAIGEKKAKGQAVDTAVKLASLYHRGLAPIIDPIDETHIEMPWQVEYEGFGFDLAGTMDVVTKDGIRDLKTSSKTPNQNDVDNNDQLSMYALAHTAVKGALPKSISYDSLVKNKIPKIDIKTTTRTDDDLNRFVSKIEAFGDAYKKGVFLPASQQGWWCGPKWCGYYDMCKYSLKPKQFNIGAIK